MAKSESGSCRVQLSISIVGMPAAVVLVVLSFARKPQRGRALATPLLLLPIAWVASPASVCDTRREQAS